MLGIVKVLFVICVHSSVFPLLISDCTVCFENCIKRNPVPSHLVDQRQYGREWPCYYYYFFPSLVNCQILMLLSGLNILPDHASFNKAF